MYHNLSSGEAGIRGHWKFMGQLSSDYHMLSLMCEFIHEHTCTHTLTQIKKKSVIVNIIFKVILSG